MYLLLIVLVGSTAAIGLISYLFHRLMRRPSSSGAATATQSAVTLKDSTEAMKNFITAIALVVGGWWTLNLFESLQQEADARAKIANTQAETAAHDAIVQAAVLKARDFPLAVALHTTIADASGGRVVIVDAGFKNMGEGPLFFELPANAFTLAKVKGTPAGMKVLNVYRGAPVYIDETAALAHGVRTLLAQQERHVPYIFNISEPGTYLVQVLADYGDEKASPRETRANEQIIVSVN